MGNLKSQSRRSEACRDAGQSAGTGSQSFDSKYQGFFYADN